MWSEALDAILTTLRYLAPATLLTLFWGQQSFLFKLLKHIDSAFRAIIFSSEEQKQEVLQWLAEAGPVRVEHLDTVWRHGWILCGVLDAALPGACAGHSPTRLTLKHAQAIADHYLGVEPVFSRHELESNHSLSKHQEWKLATYLDRVRQALAKLTPPVSKPTSQRTSPETTQFTLSYVAKGSGLTAAQVNHRMYFKIYPTTQQSLDPGEITILIRGPKDTYGMTVIPPILGKAQLIRQKLLGLNCKPNYTESTLPITQGTAYMRNYGKNDMNKTYHIPKTKYDVEIEVEMRKDHARVGYTVNLEGKYEVSITSRGQSIVGSPFNVTASRNILRTLEKESFCLEDGEEIDIVDVKTDRKIVLRIVDFVTEKMLLRENGTLEKISEDEAKALMENDSTDVTEHKEVDSIIPDTDNVTELEVSKTKSDKFYNTVNKVLTMNKICKIFQDIPKREVFAKEMYSRPMSQQGIPDIVNSTFGDLNLNPYILSEKRDRFIVPENISVSIRTEKPAILLEEKIVENTHQRGNKATEEIIERERSESVEDLIHYTPMIDEEILMYVGDVTPTSNPFLHDNYQQDYKEAKAFGAFVNTEYETNNSQETSDSPVQIFVDEDIATGDAGSPVNSNPFVDPDLISMERPKTPVFKIITGDIANRGDSVYVKSDSVNDDIDDNEFINPFFAHRHHQANELEESLTGQITDFIIGAPVSLPPMMRAPSPEPKMTSLVMKNERKNLYFSDNKQTDKRNENLSQNVSPTDALIPEVVMGYKVEKPFTSSTFHSLESFLTENTEATEASSTNNGYEPYLLEPVRKDEHITLKKDTWDSAYVSIDDNNSSPDTNNNESHLSNDASKAKFSPSEGNHDLKHTVLSNIGPAERELWESCQELSVDTSQLYEEAKSNRWEATKRPIFTPIMEENDRSMSTGMKDLPKAEIATTIDENDPITVAFAELDEAYNGYFPNSEPSSIYAITEDVINVQNKELEYTIEWNDARVDSASEVMSDVMRRATALEGTISEVQANVTESVSVSQPLHVTNNDETSESISETLTLMEPIEHVPTEAIEATQFGDKNQTNFVLERKKYWDDKIREIETMKEETKQQQKPLRRRMTSRYLRHNDSLTKRKGKQIVKNFLSADSVAWNEAIATDITQITRSQLLTKVESVDNETKLVNKWKEFWDHKLEVDQESEAAANKVSSNRKERTISQPILNIIHGSEDNEVEKDSNEPITPGKQDLPEEVFKAFETSPKRFFGTSRKQILSKIDSFLAGQRQADKSPVNVINTGHDSGLVSSRVSLFHSISQTEEVVPWRRRKCQSLQNISNRKDSERSFTSVDVDILDKKIEEEPDKDMVDEIIKTESKEDIYIDNIVNKETLKDRRSRLINPLNNISYDETISHAAPREIVEASNNYVKRKIKDFNRQSQERLDYQSLRKTSISRSEMDIFNRNVYKAPVDDLDKHKSYDELPSISVKKFINLYESVKEPNMVEKPMRRSRTNSAVSQKYLQEIGSVLGTAVKPDEDLHDADKSVHSSVNDINEVSPVRTKRWTKKSTDKSITSDFNTSCSSIDTEFKSETKLINIDTKSKEKITYLSCSDIELEIVEQAPEMSPEIQLKQDVAVAETDYKSRFKMAKQYFQSLEELREEKKPKKLNECQQMLLENAPAESPNSSPHKRERRRVKKNIKSNSLPSTEISKIWDELQEKKSNGSKPEENKLVKISEKFNVEDLFTDVTEGRLSRQGSFRGIPHKKAVLETFRSMENISDKTMSPYEMAVSQLNDFAQENQIKNAQTYLSEYPYLPTTDPSKYQSRFDAKASGLISMKELLNTRPRRNSVPDLRLNPSFTVDL